MANTVDENRSKNWIPRLKATSRFIFSQRKLSLAADKSISVPPTFAIGPKWGKRLELWTEFSTSLGRWFDLTTGSDHEGLPALRPDLTSVNDNLFGTSWKGIFPSFCTLDKVKHAHSHSLARLRLAILRLDKRNFQLGTCWELFLNKEELMSLSFVSCWDNVFFRYCSWLFFQPKNYWILATLESSFSWRTQPWASFLGASHSILNFLEF